VTDTSQQDGLLPFIRTCQTKYLNLAPGIKIVAWNDYSLQMLF